MSDLYEVITTWTTCQHNHGADWASYEDNYNLVNCSTYKQAIKEFNDSKNDTSMMVDSIFILKGDKQIKYYTPNSTEVN